MNLGQMKTALRRYAGVDATDPLADWINDAITEYQAAFDWPYLVTPFTALTSEGSDTVALPTNFFKIMNVRADGDKTGLGYMPIRQFVDEVSDIEKWGKPVIYTLAGGLDGIKLWPTPDAQYTLRMYVEVREPVLSVDANSPAYIPERYHYTLVQGAAIRALQAESEEERAETTRGIFEDAIVRTIGEYGGNLQSGQFNTVRDVMQYGQEA